MVTPFYDILAALLIFAALLKLSHDCVVQRMPPPATAALALWWFGAVGAAFQLFSIYQLMWFMPATYVLSRRLAIHPLANAPIFSKAAPVLRLFILAGSACIPALLLVASMTERG